MQLSAGIFIAVIMIWLSMEDKSETRCYAVIERDTAMPGENPKVDKTLDVRGLACPRPKAVTERTLEKMKSGQSLQVITDDMSTRQSIPSFCESLGYELLNFREDGGVLYFTIRK
jgi:tRNA 2-thiouridine synthesizing protein A